MRSPHWSRNPAANRPPSRIKSGTGFRRIALYCPMLFGIALPLLILAVAAFA